MHLIMFVVNHLKGNHNLYTIQRKKIILLYYNVKKRREKVITRVIHLIHMTILINPFQSLFTSIRLERENHIPYLKKGLESLSRWMMALDASKPWLTYWILHSLELLEEDLSPEHIERFVLLFILKCEVVFCGRGSFTSTIMIG